jgi:hypothetical protein
MKTRLERWETPREISFAVTPGNEELYTLFGDTWAKARAEKEPPFDTFIEGARELIFELREGKAVFHIVGYYLDTGTLKLKASLGFEILHDDDDYEEHVVYILGLATAQDVPVYANSDTEAEVLAACYRELHVNGLLVPDGEGKKVRLKLTRSPGARITTYGYLDELRISDFHSPAELLLIRESVRQELAKRDAAGRVLEYLRVAIRELSTHLDDTKRNERVLQRCLERHPILFGAEYDRIVPKHRLGGEFEMDYALVRVTGLVDLVEIESSTLALFNKSGDPSSQLVHAEQQVLNWLEWIERHHSYAREDLPSLTDPMGYVVIGRNSRLDEHQRRRLNRRNAMFGRRLQVLTYDDLLRRASNLLGLLESGGGRVI